MFTFNMQSAGSRKSSASKPRRSSKKPSKKQLAALARGREIRAKNIKKRRSKKNQQGGCAATKADVEKDKKMALQQVLDREAEEESRRLRLAAEIERQQREEMRRKRATKKSVFPWKWSRK